MNKNSPQKPLAIEIALTEENNSSQNNPIDSIFNFEDHSIRVIIDEITGEPWFNANDVCDVLEFGNYRQALLSHVNSDHVQKMDGVVKTGKRADGSVYHQIGKINYINEFGVYDLILGSKKPEAKRLKKWVTSEVLPTIRKTGTYSIKPDQNFEVKSNPQKHTLKFIADETAGADFLAKYVGLSGNQAILSTCQMIRKTYDVDILILTGQTKGLISESQQHDFSPTEIGGMLKPIQSARKVNQLLIELGYQIREQNPKLNRVVYQPTDLAKSLAVLKDTLKKYSDGTPILQVRWFDAIVDILQSEIFI